MRKTNSRLIYHPVGRNIEQVGKGPLEAIANTLKSYYTEGEFPGERHAISMDPRFKGQKMQFNGPGTNLQARLQRGDTGINDLDKVAKKHDIDYNNAMMKYKQTGDKKQFVSDIHKADKAFIPAAWNSRDDPQMGKISSTLMTSKMLAEKSGLLPTAVFSGAGKKVNADPVANLRLKLLESNIYEEDRKPMKKERKSRRKSRSRSRSRSRSNSSRRSRSMSNRRSRSRSNRRSRSQIGGIPVGALITVLTTAAPYLIDFFWDKFKGSKKQDGSGKSSKYRGLSIEDKREIMIDHLRRY